MLKQEEKKRKQEQPPEQKTDFQKRTAVATSQQWLCRCQHLLRSATNSNGEIMQDCHLGQTMVLYRSAQHRWLEGMFLFRFYFALLFSYFCLIQSVLPFLFIFTWWNCDKYTY